MIIYDYFSSVFCIVPKKVLLLKYRKWVNHLKNRYHYAKVVENARINFSINPYCTLLFSRKENFKFLKAAFSAVLWPGWLRHECVRISALRYCQYHTGHLLTFRKLPQKLLNKVQDLPSVLQQLTFVLLASFFINLEHLSHPTLVLLFILWRQMLAESVPWNFCHNNTVMLIYSQVSNRRDSSFVNYSVFCHPPQPY